MPLATPTFDELLAYATAAVKEKTGITNFSESSIAGALLKVFVAYIENLYSMLATLDEQGNLSTAAGANLDKIGQLFGVTRLPAKAATTAGAGNAVIFRNVGDEAVTIPIGTRIWSPNAPQVSYTTDYQITVQSGGESYVDVTAVSPGAYYNVGPQALTAHDLGDTNTTVTNALSISNGTGIESDDNYRYRISNSLLTVQGANETSIRIKLLEIPGVKDVILQPMARGTGTLDVVVLSVDRRVTATLLEQVQTTLDSVVAFGISALAKAPVERPIDLTIKLALSSQLNATLARSQASVAARSYIDNLPVGDATYSGNMIYNELVSRIMDSHPDITNAQIRMSIDNTAALNIDITADPGVKFYLRGVDVS